MSEIKTPRQLAEERSALAGKRVASFKEAGIASVRSLDLNTVTEGEVVAIPTDFKIFEQPIAGSTNKAVKVISEEGKDVFMGVFTRGAMPADGSAYVRPSGTVVEAIQKYASMDEAFRAEVAGKKICFTKKTVVTTKDRFSANGGLRDVNVWQIDFAA